MSSVSRITVRLLAALLGLAFGNTSFAVGSRTLHLYTWSDYIDPALVAEFESEHDATLRFSYFESDEERDQELAASGGDGFDLIMMSDTRIGSHGRRGWLAPIERDRVPNLAHVEPRWTDAVPGAREYGVPYLFGMMGIVWRSDLVAAPPTRWKDLLEPDRTLRGRLIMSGDARELVGVAMLAGGDSANDGSRDAVRRAGDRLAAQRPHVSGYGYPSLGPESSLASGETIAAMMYSGDALTLREHTPSIAYAVPEEGALLWVDYLTVAASSRRKPLAHAFLDFMNRPENAARLAEYLYYPTPNAAARALLPAEFLADPIIYPSDAELRRSAFLTPLPPRTVRLVNSIGAELRLH